jgi:eukaryotic-like serine/threonine-protein kinase
MMALAAPLSTLDAPHIDTPRLPEVPRVIAGKYRLEGVLSEGGMGSVWRAFNLQLEVPVAIKLLRADLSGEELGERLRVEARAAAKLVHPSIIRIFDIGDSEAGEPFIVMELLTGQSLGELLARGPLPAVNAVQLLLPIAEALSLAHSRGVVHRDLKPDNIFLASEGDALQPKLLDFGIAKVTSTAATGRGVLTQTGTLLGSPDYMAPEQAYGQSDIDERCDIWAFCVVLYEAIAGVTPFSSSSVQSTLRRVVQDEPPPLDELAGVDATLASLVQRGMSKDRDQRPSSIFELGEQLATWLAVQGVYEDVTGTSLETKWLGRSSDTLLMTSSRAMSGPQALHEQHTLVSVNHPRPTPDHEMTRTTQSTTVGIGRPRRRWLPGVLVAGVGLLGWLGWVSALELRAHAQLRQPLPHLAPTPKPAAHVADPIPIVPIAALAHETPPPAPPEIAARPMDRPARDQTRRGQQWGEPTRRGQLVAEPTRRGQHLAAAAKPRAALAPAPGRVSIPAAPPTSTALLRDPAADLIQPY